MIKREEVREKREVRLVIMVLVPQCGVLSSAQLMSDVTWERERAWVRVTLWQIKPYAPRETFHDHTFKGSGPYSRIPKGRPGEGAYVKLRPNAAGAWAD